mgnify:CR=1 FL=1
MFWQAAVERVAVLLVAAFILTSIPGFGSIFRRMNSSRMTMIHIVMLGLFGIVSTTLGFVINDQGEIVRDIVWRASSDEWVLSFALMAIVIAGLLGGANIGLGAGLMTSIHLLFVGGLGLYVHAMLFPVAGLWAGLAGRYFAKDRIVTPVQAFFIGLVPAVIYVGMIAFHPDLPLGLRSAIADIIIPYTIIHSIGVVVFLAMITIVLREQEAEAARATQFAIQLVEEAIPYLKEESASHMAKGLAELLYKRLPLAVAVTVTDDKEVLYHEGIGHSHEVDTPLARKAYRTKKAVAAFTPTEIQCPYETCPLRAAVIIPVMTEGAPIRYIKLYFRKQEQVTPVELVLAEGIGMFITSQLNTIRHERLQDQMRDAELRSLQAQINPHFLFNTLHLIASLIRIDPMKARHITVQLASFMRFNMNIVRHPLISLEKELEHVGAYRDIITTRFSNRLTIEIEKKGSIEDVYLPPSTLQPLIENAVQHGVSEQDEGHIVLSIDRHPTYAKIVVRDNGQGFPKDEVKYLGRKPAEQSDSGTGLYNVRSRFLQLLGPEASFTCYNDDGAVTVLHIPLKRESKKKG